MNSTTFYKGHTLKHATVEDFERWLSPSGALMTDEEYDRHFKRVRQMLVDSGDYEEFNHMEEGEDVIGVIDIDAGLILNMPHLNPEYF